MPLKVEDIKVGQGAEAKSGQSVTVHYVGTLTDGKKFDSSRDRGEGFEFTLGAGEVIQGWDQGVAGMKIGGLRRLTVPPELGYGKLGYPPVIPSNATLIFEVELLAVGRAALDRSRSRSYLNDVKLYYAPGACSLSPHIVLREAGLPFELERVDLKTHRTEHGEDYCAVNPKGYVPLLELDDGQRLTEGPAIVQYLADKQPEAKLVPAPRTLERYRLIEWLSFINSELHKAYSPFFNPKTTPEVLSMNGVRIARRFDLIAQRLEQSAFLLGEDFSVADAYLFVMLRWAKKFGPDLAQWPALQAYFERLASRPAVQAALIAEGLKVPAGEAAAHSTAS